MKHKKKSVEKSRLLWIIRNVLYTYIAVVVTWAYISNTSKKLVHMFPHNQWKQFKNTAFSIEPKIFIWNLISFRTICNSFSNFISRLLKYIFQSAFGNNMRNLNQLNMYQLFPNTCPVLFVHFIRKTFHEKLLYCTWLCPNVLLVFARWWQFASEKLLSRNVLRSVFSTRSESKTCLIIVLY